MKKITLIAASLGLALSPLSYADENLTQARELVKQFGGQLQPALGQAMQSGGPMSAIEVCKTKAPEIARQIAHESNWDINRVSMKNRAPNAEPDAWERIMLQRFEAQLAAGEDPNQFEHGAIVHEDGKSHYRYIRAIMIGANQPCLHCHGTEINPAVKQKILELYPNDKATGYQTGQIRGAFSFKKPL
ncbi:DUF3365 domain-containing protein [Thiomicrospira microaerophila]|uniref:Tll0287-like domain-containing protein n=1 Tax=Thiomicrospira microaerophila TaxID=406020 RepID=UPI00200C7DF8|nr:DUF3365 domain-containing protein [Thiomicrospira microaerophila]UQB42459.1 DUF3365 domain-containing protein [Thiomicrospira microaerophila]